MSSKTFAVKNDNQDVCDCLVKIAEKNGYKFNNTEQVRAWLCFYPFQGQNQRQNIVQYIEYNKCYPKLSAVDDFAEIIRRLEKPTPVHVKIGEFDGEIVDNGKTVELMVISYKGFTIDLPIDDLRKICENSKFKYS